MILSIGGTRDSLGVVRGGGHHVSCPGFVEKHWYNERSLEIINAHCIFNRLEFEWRQTLSDVLDVSRLDADGAVCVGQVIKQYHGVNVDRASGI